LTMNINPITKSRNLPLVEFYAVLQREFISYFVRSQIYPPEYAAKYALYCICKREKIEKIGVKNALPSIFNASGLRDQYIENFLTAFGLPNFEYRDDNSRKIMGKYDKEYWFGSGVSIRVKTIDGVILTVVTKNLSTMNKVVADINGEMKQFDYAYITRIISDNLVNF
jgi:hypothetical protein